MEYGEYETESSLYHEFDCAIDEILGNEPSRNQKEQLISSLVPLFYKYTERFSDYANNDNIFASPTYLYPVFGNSTPQINLFIVNSAPRPYCYPYSSYQQQQIGSVTPQNPYNFYNPQYQIIPQQQLIQSVYPIQNVEQTDKKSKKKSKSNDKKSKYKHDKSSKKSKKSKDSKKHKAEIQVFDTKPSNQFDGIIRFLTTKTGGNIHQNGTIQISSNSKSGKPPEHLLNLNSDDYFDTNSGSKDYWIKYDFKNREIEISNYSIKSYSYSSGHLKSWVLEVSDNDQSWETIDEHSDDPSLNGNGKASSFTVKKKRFARYCRIRCTGEFWGYRPFVSPGICKIEFYGRLKSPKS